MAGVTNIRFPYRSKAVTTSKRVAKVASKQLQSKKSTKKQREVAGSDLEQAKTTGKKR
jgi:hypothetical protein